MTKIYKNHPQLLILLIAAAVLALLASPVEARVFPHHILNGINYESLNEYSRFSWKWIQRKTETFRALTVETSQMTEKPEDQELNPITSVHNTVRPWNLNRMSDFQEGLALQNSYFSLRNGTNTGGHTYSFVTLEEYDSGISLAGCSYRLYSPFDFVGNLNFTKELDSQLTKFQWRWFTMNDGSSQRVVTMEDDSTSESHYVNSGADICS